MSSTGTVLIVEDERNMRRVLRALLEREGYQVLEAPDGARALEDIAFDSVDVVLTDLKMPQVNGLELLDAICSRDPTLPVILLTAFGTVGSAVEALKRGALDYLTKPFDPEQLVSTIEKGVRLRQRQSMQAPAELEQDPELLLEGESPALIEVRRRITRAAPTDATVLLTGESGSGKELMARALQRRSHRSGGPFLKINCAAIPEALFESELFGYERGAFTGASHSKPGRFELAEGGTLFLDEIGEIPPAVQPKLLRALQDRAFFRVGGVKTIEVDVRLIAATNRDLEADLASGRFREDLFYRLNVVPIHVPALRERTADIPALAHFFLRRSAHRHGKSIEGFEPAAISALVQFPWPGNLRQLENCIERATLFADGPTLRPQDLPTEIRPAQTSDSERKSVPLRERVRDATRSIEREAILEALRRTEGNVTQAARALGLSRRGLQLKMKELEIERV